MTSPTPPGGYAPAPMNAADQRLWATLAHVGGIVFGFVPSLVIFIVCKDRGGFVRRHSAEALNFQITVAIATTVLSFLGTATIVIGIGVLLLLAAGVVWVANIVLCILAAVAANRGEEYRYPWAWRPVV